MCGIAGILGVTGDHAERAVGRMLDSIAHRGPDGRGVMALPNGALGHARLSIVDVAGGHQPMSTHDGVQHIVFNGEVYGYQKLRRELAEYPYATTSDTEVILAAYRRYGTDMLAHLPGMFAFALWDSRSQLLFAARDRFGEKPLFYATPHPNVFIFASEIKALLASGLLEAQVDRRAVAYYLRHHTPPDRTIYKNVFSLGPAHCLHWDGRSHHVQRYWSVPRPAGYYSTLADAADHFRTLAHQAVERQLVADVEVGAFLSGGLDSSTVVALASKVNPSIRTFCAEFSGTSGEAHYARRVASRFGTRHSELQIGHYSLPDTLQRLAEVFDEPFGDNSSVPTYLIAQKAREHVKVVLTGDGGDEIFGGYPWNKELCWAEATPRPSYWQWQAARVVSRVARTLRMDCAERVEQRNIGIGYARRHPTVFDAHLRQMTGWADVDRLQRLGLGDCLAEIDSWERRQEYGDDVSSAMIYDIQVFMPGDILTKIDRASMAHGLELRAPFLDVALAEFCLTLPRDLRITTTEDKRILRAAFEDEWPDEIRRRPKQGFGAPVDVWLSSTELRPIIAEVLFSPSSALFDLLPFEQLSEQFRQSNPMRQWALLCLGLWAKTWLRREHASTLP
jgi:asparagine synthase (glutamine-hydrolysing)